MASWEVQDSGQQSARPVETQEVIGQLATGGLGIYAKVRRAGESQWTPIYQTQEFHMLCPFINSQYASNFKIGSLNGNIMISNDVQRLTTTSAAFRSGPGFYNRVGFHAPIFDRESPGLISSSGKIFRCWDNFWVGPLLTGRPSISDEKGSFLLYLFALNTHTSSQTHELHPYDYPIPKEEKDNLVFAVPAGALVFNKVRIPVARDKGAGVHTLTFRTATTSDKVGKGVLVGAVTLGSVVYKAGHRGFTIALPVMPPGTPGMTTPPHPTSLYCWCGQALNNLYCEECSSRPFICLCGEGSTLKVSQQFSRLPKLVQERFASMNLSGIWQKTPAELTDEERVPLTAESTSQTQSPPSQ